MIGLRLPLQRTSSLVSRVVPLGLPVLALLALAGCGIEPYETRMKETLKELDHGNKFIGLSKTYTKLVFPANEATVQIAPRIKLPDAPFSFGQAYIPGSKDPDNQNVGIPTNRVLPPPPLPAVPGYQESFEQYVGTALGFRLWHLYVGVVRYEPGSGGGDKTLAAILEHVKAEVGKMDPNKEPVPKLEDLVWREESIPTLSQSPPVRRWKVLEIDTHQPFYTRGSTELTMQPGICRIMALDIPGNKTPGMGDHQIFLVWRYSQSTKDLPRIQKLMTSCVGTLEIDPAPAAAPAASKPN